MLAGLFDDDDGGAAMEAAKPTTAFGGLQTPPDSRARCGFAGLENQGATCYLNSLLQACYMTPEFRGGLYAVDPKELNVENWNPETGAVDVKKRHARVVPIELQLLFTRLQYLNQKHVSTMHLTQRGFSWKDNQGGDQHDAHELNRLLFDVVENHLKGTSGSNLIQRLYGGKWAIQTICAACKNVSEREEAFTDITVRTQGMDNLIDGLEATVVSELLNGDNQYVPQVGVHVPEHVRWHVQMFALWGGSSGTARACVCVCVRVRWYPAV